MTKSDELIAMMSKRGLSLRKAAARLNVSHVHLYLVLSRGRISDSLLDSLEVLLRSMPEKPTQRTQADARRLIDAGCDSMLISRGIFRSVICGPGFVRTRVEKQTTNLERKN